MIVYLTENICKKFEIQLVGIHICFQNKCGVPSSNAKAIWNKEGSKEWGKEGLHINEIGIHVQTIKTIN